MTSEKFFKEIEKEQAPPVLPRNAWWIIRVDGRAFHTWTRTQGFARPYDALFMKTMDLAAEALCEEIQNARMAFVQSDEISVLVKAEGRAQSWFGGELAKVLSISASAASVVVSANRKPGSALAVFDSRVITLGNSLDVERYFHWRQRDAWINAVTMIAQSHFSHKQLHGKSTRERLVMVQDKTGKQLSELAPEGFLRGRAVRAHHVIETVTYQHKRTGDWQQTQCERTYWRADAAPWFEQSPGFIIPL